MAAQISFALRAKLAHEARASLLADAKKVIVELGAQVQERLTTLMNEAAPSREMQIRRDAWTFYQRSRPVWVEGTLKAWQTKLDAPAPKKTPKSSEDTGEGLELLGMDVVENKILASRLVLPVVEKVSTELDDLKLRIRFLEGSDDFDEQDILRPEVLIQDLIDQWFTSGMQRDSWPLVNELAQRLFIDRLKVAYKRCNELLIKQGVMPTIDLKDRVKRAMPGLGAPIRPPAPLPVEPARPEEGQYHADANWQGAQADAADSGGRFPQTMFAPPGGSGASTAGSRGGHSAGGQASGAQQGGSSAGSYASPPPPKSSGGFFGGRLGWGSDRSSSGPSTGGQGELASHSSGGAEASAYAGAHEETRMMTQASPLARARSKAVGVMGQLKRLLVGSVGADFDATAHQTPSPALAAAMSARPERGLSSAGSGTVMEDYSPAGMARFATELRAQTSELKQKAETKSEKATIEIVALMFQAILAEERIPPAIRVWFARLQIPVLRVALSEPDFFGTLNHPARQLIDRMGSCVMGFDASAIKGGELEAEIKRVVQVIEQYPETGKRVFQLVFDEFQKFLTKFLSGQGPAKKVVSVAQQVEQKETLTIQYTIEMRNMLKDIPVRDEIRTFLFKVWAEVLAVAAVRKGPQDIETVTLKKCASELLWSASAKPNRSDRARVIQDLPNLLQRLRAGMSLLGLSPSDQDAHIKTVSDTLADAFLSKTQAIPQAQIDALAQRLANLEDFVSEDGMGDLPLDAESIEMMLGIDASMIDVVANGGSKPTPAMVAWAQELQLGSWFTLDHNGRINQVQFAWRSDRKHLNLFASSDGHSFLIQAGRLAAYLQAGLLLPQEEETLTVRATREALNKLEANPERLLS